MVQLRHCERGLAPHLEGEVHGHQQPMTELLLLVCKYVLENKKSRYISPKLNQVLSMSMKMSKVKNDPHY